MKMQKHHVKPSTKLVVKEKKEEKKTLKNCRNIVLLCAVCPLHAAESYETTSQ